MMGRWFHVGPSAEHLNYIAAIDSAIDALQLKKLTVVDDLNCDEVPLPPEPHAEKRCGCCRRKSSFTRPEP